jgi:hypothetical protein
VLKGNDLPEVVAFRHSSVDWRTVIELLTIESFNGIIIATNYISKKWRQNDT